ncbi:hypothetical protein [Citrobacter braakii]|uniref:hypothetical protein n=1 Tax=Citrobacter braakii TaxID=57706 RepID=UPI0011EBFD0D|nr:hypothetical protein [Citrobacter braakii]
MRTETVTPLNYTPSAIDDLRTLERDCLHEAPYAAYVLRNLIDLLENSVKFTLPNCADFIAPEDLRQTHLDLARLPYPVVTFEIPWEKEGTLETYFDKQALRSTKRIALCWEAKVELEPVPGINRVLERFPGGGFLSVPFTGLMTGSVGTRVTVDSFTPTIILSIPLSI